MKYRIQVITFNSGLVAYYPQVSKNWIERLMHGWEYLNRHGEEIPLSDDATRYSFEACVDAIETHKRRESGKNSQKPKSITYRKM